MLLARVQYHFVTNIIKKKDWIRIKYQAWGYIASQFFSINSKISFVIEKDLWILYLWTFIIFILPFPLPVKTYLVRLALFASRLHDLCENTGCWLESNRKADKKNVFINHLITMKKIFDLRKYGTTYFSDHKQNKYLDFFQNSWNDFSGSFFSFCHWSFI